MENAVQQQCSADLLEYLKSDELYRLATTLIFEQGMGDRLLPAQVEYVRRQIPSLLTASTLVVDVLTGTSKANRLGKWRPGWLFTSAGAEQATHPVIAAYHASHFRDVHTVTEVCAGCGVDTAALADVAGQVVCYEQDPVTAAVLTGNLARNKCTNVVVNNEAFTAATVIATKAVWADPSRRKAHGQRLRDATLYQPPLEVLYSAIVSCKVEFAGIKVGPGDRVSRPVGATSEYIGWKRECREHILWIARPPLQQTGSPTKLTLFKDGATPGVIQAGTDLPAPPECGNVQPGMYIIEPHAAIIAAGAVNDYFTRYSAMPVDKMIAYGITNTKPPSSPFHSTYKVVAISPGIRTSWLCRQVRTLELPSTTTIKKRGWNGNPVELHKKLPFQTDVPVNSEYAIVITRKGHDHITIICEVVE